jgi:hypothetical protein
MCIIYYYSLKEVYYSLLKEKGFNCNLLVAKKGEHIQQDMSSDLILEFLVSYLI